MFCVIGPRFGRDRIVTIARTVRSIAILAVLIVLADAIWIVFRQASESAQSHVCQQHLRSLSGALLQYSADWNNTFPPANRWVDCIDNKKYLPDVDRTAVFHCPAASAAYGYAMNRSAGGVSLETSDTGGVVLLFETESAARNACGSLQDIAQPRHANNNCSYCDGSVHWVNLFTKQRWLWSIPRSTLR